MMLRGRMLALLDRAARVAETVLRPGFVGAVRRSRPFSIAASRIVSGLLADGIQPAVVLDVGANKGQFAAAALHAWPDADVISFEPLPASARSLRSIDSGRLEVHEVALGRTDGEIRMYEHSYSPSSSILPPLASEAQVGAIERTVPLRTLDSLVPERRLAGRSCLLKLDVQGYELEVLGGAAVTLAHVDAVVVEQALDASYGGQPLFDDVHQVLVAAGFSLTRLVDWRRVAGRVVEVDCLYRRPSI